MKGLDAGLAKFWRIKTNGGESLPRVGRGLWKLTLGLAFLGTTAWAALAIYFSNLPEALRAAAALAYVVAAIVFLVRLRPRKRQVFAVAGLFVAVLLWWLWIPPSNDRQWQPDVAVLARAEIDGDRVTIRSLRDCEYRSESDYTVRHRDLTVDLGKLQTADLFLCYWGVRQIAHTMMSFGFEGGEQVCVSIEARKELGEGYSALKGFFKQFELVSIVADERDLVRLRTDFRGEEVYLYRLRADPSLLRNVFLDYLRQLNRLAETPEWYNAATSNCTSNIRGHTLPYTKRASWSWKLLINGYIDELGYANGAIDQSLPFEELRSRSRINDCARAAAGAADFSRRIREGLSQPASAPEETHR